MKAIVLVLMGLMGAEVAANAQVTTLGSRTGFGGHIGQYQRDFNLGLNLTSPYFCYKKLAVRARANMAWNEHLNTSNEITWSSYSHVSVGVVSIAGQAGDFVRLYGEGGVLLLFPSEDFSSSSANMGGYGLFGFEFFMYENANYFLEVGGVGTGARADKIAGSPIYSNGLLMNVGFRYQL